jgi:cell division protein FtsQ
MPGSTDVRDVVDDEATIALARRRFVRRQWARRWLAWRTGLGAVLILGLVAVVTWLVFFSSVLAVRGVQVVGHDVLSTREVREAAAVPTGEPLATVDLGAVTARVQKLDPVLRVDVSRAWPDRVRVAVTERTAVAVVQRDGGLRGFDANGVLFRSYPERPPGLPLVQMGAGAQSDALAEAAAVIDTLPSTLSTKVGYLRVQSIDTISLKLRDGRSVLWGSAEDSRAKSRVLEVLLERKAQWYDVSVPGRPVIRR